MNPKSGKLITAVSPIMPEQVFTADTADPEKSEQDKAEQVSQKVGKYGAIKPPPFKASTDNKKNDEESTQAAEAWLEIVLKDEAGNLVSGQKYEITLPNGNVAKGSTDSKGRAKVEGFVSGECILKLPALHADAWQNSLA